MSQDMRILTKLRENVLACHLPHGLCVRTGHTSLTLGFIQSVSLTIQRQHVCQLT